MSGWNTNIFIFSPITNPFPKGYKYYIYIWNKEEGKTQQEAARLPILGFFSIDLNLFRFLF